MLDNAIFVFGANQLGIHGKGAALHAAKFYGAEKGVGEGLTGYSYAIPTKSTPNASLRLEQVKYHVDKFLEFAGAHQDKIFQVTRIGCGLAGFSDEQIYPLFSKRSENVLLSRKWLKIENPELAPAIVIAGGRDFRDFDFLVDRCDFYLSRFLESGKNFEIVSGGAKGADFLGERYAKEVLNVMPNIFNANWERFGKAAGMVRNELMAWHGSHLIAFWDGKSVGTKNMIQIAQREEMFAKVVRY